ncbi:cytochrome P450 71A9-like [Hibiscus syriacus]|uniref:Cytochrome P450 71A9-like n=1 Tax=Hibiscus syriacus TaxID=106335 RepID=A0A6A2Z268_HIBSY|nr:cytochrome P450 71A9-like [Hibiscus syriacus]
MTADEGNVKIEKFDGTDFGFWKMQIEDFLYQKNLYQPLSGKQPEGMKNEDWALPDRQALEVIRLTLSRNVAFNIAKEKTTAGLMAALSSMHEKPSASNKVHLMRRLFNLQMTEGASVAQHLNELNTITTQLSSVEIEFDDEVRALILLSSLPDSLNATVTAVSSSSGNSKLKFDDVRDLVLSKEIRRRESGEASTSSALHTESRGRTSERNSNHGRSKSRRALKKNTGVQESANVTEETGDAMILSINSPIESWILDSGASFHSTPCQEIMENYVSGDFGKVHLADDETLKILDGEGYSTTFSGCEWKITKGALVIARGKKIGTVYVTSNLENIIAVANVDGKSNLWHQRLSHMSEKGMKIFLSKGKLPDLKNVDVGLCEDCIFGKQKKVSFAKIGKAPKAERNVWVYFLKKKLEVFDTFRKWKAMVENETGLKVKRLWSDNGGEYRDSRFRDFCANNGIKMETTVPITPQQNGVAECMNRTLNERARSMRIHAGLPKFLWAEAINTAAYLINRGPSVPLDGGIPKEAWSKKEINLSHLRVFGCISYVHIDSAERSKLDAKSNKCAFVGYGGDEFGYRFWDYENRKIIRSIDVIFNENMMYKDRSTAESSNIEAETKEFAEFEEISRNDVQINPEAVQEEPRTPELRRSSRIPKPTQRYSPSLHYLLLPDNGELECYDEAMQTWELAELPPGKKALHNKWIYRIKEEHDGSKRYKARLVVKGFQQKEGIDYNEIFSPVVKLSTIRLVLKIVAAENLHLEQLNVKTAFLHGDLEEEIYMSQSEGFTEAGKKNLVCRLKKSLYGLKQAPRQWYKKFDSFMGSSGFTRCQSDHCCYIKRFDNSFIILLLYVDDMLVAGSDMQEIIHLKQKLSKQFAMKDLGAAKQILEMRIKRDTKSGTLMLSQAEYINKALSRFNMQDVKPVSTPLGVHFRLSKEQSPKMEEERAHMVKVPYASAIGSLMYVMVCTRPDIAQAVGAVSRYMNNPGKVHWEAVKWILRYLRGTTNKALCFKGGDTILTGYVDADLAGNVDIRRSTTGYVYTLGGTAVSWVSQLQKIVALSTTEAEYVAVTEASKEMVTMEEIKQVVFEMNPSKALGIDGFKASFFSQKNWAILWNGSTSAEFSPSRDDLVLFMEASMDQLEEGISRGFQFTQVEDLGRYLGVPLLHHFVTYGTYNYLMQKMDTWLGNIGSLNEIRCGAIPGPVAPIKVTDMVSTQGDWKWDEFIDCLPEYTRDYFAAVKPPFTVLWRRSPWLDPLWRFNELPRVRVFLWLACKGRLLTNEERARRHIANNASCSVCSATTESISHVLRDCVEACATLNEFIHPDRLKSFFSMDIADWVLFNLKHPNYFPTHANDWEQLFRTILWSLWRRRNQRIFEPETSIAECVICLSLAWDLGLRSIILETDSRDTWLLLKQARSSVVSSPLMPHLAELMRRNWNVRVTHVVRERNEAADCMARIAWFLPSCSRTYSTSPAEVLSLIQAEAHSLA